MNNTDSNVVYFHELNIGDIFYYNDIRLTKKTNTQAADCYGLIEIPAELIVVKGNNHAY